MTIVDRCSNSVRYLLIITCCAALGICLAGCTTGTGNDKYDNITVQGTVYNVDDQQPVPHATVNIVALDGQLEVYHATTTTTSLGYYNFTAPTGPGVQLAYNVTVYGRPVGRGRFENISQDLTYNMVVET